MVKARPFWRASSRKLNIGLSKLKISWTFFIHFLFTWLVSKLNERPKNELNLRL